MKAIYLLLFLLIVVSYETENEKIVWKFLRKEGLTEAGAGGLMGNLQAESNMRSVVYENRYKPKFGSDQDYVDMVNNGSYTNLMELVLAWHNGHLNQESKHYMRNAKEKLEIYIANLNSL